MRNIKPIGPIFLWLVKGYAMNLVTKFELRTTFRNSCFGPNKAYVIIESCLWPSQLDWISMWKYSYIEMRRLQRYSIHFHDPGISQKWLFTNFSDGTPPLKITFDDLWYNESRNQTKITFYASLKTKFICENYLSITNNAHCKGITRLRISAHKLGIEIGRYSNKPPHQKRLDQRCKFCLPQDNTSTDATNEPPFPNLIIEDEMHFLADCPSYSHIRERLSDNLSLKIKNNDLTEVFESIELTRELSKYIFLAPKHRDQLLKPTPNLTWLTQCLHDPTAHTHPSLSHLVLTCHTITHRVAGR